MPPKLLSINSYYYYRGGAETIFLEQNRLFESLGWDVVPFAMHHAKNLSTPWSRYFVEEIEFGEAYSLTQKITRAQKVIYSFEARRKLGRLIDDVHPDVAHAHNVYHHISPSVLGLLKRRGIPTVLTLHDLKVACPAYNMLAADGVCERCKGGRLHNVLVHRCIKGSVLMSSVIMAEAVLHKLLGSYSRCVNRFVVPSRFYISKLTEWGMPAEQFRHVPNFVDVPHYEPRYTPGDYFLYLGRLSREKGLGTLIRAAGLAGCKVALAGTGPQSQELQALARQTQADVHFLGYLTGDALREATRNARAIVLPSECYENAPMSVLEAYALGKPVIGARIGGIPELIREGETGLSFASGDVGSLVVALQNLNAQPASILEDMGRTGRRWVETEFTAQLYRDRLLNVYRELGVRATTAAPMPASL
jgi:glycosyltransferase involved in cell wall biosynthesis